MAIGWFIAPYKRSAGRPVPTRYCAIDDFTTAIFADGGNWAESEILGDRAIVKVRASAATLTSIANTAGITRIPLNALDNALSSLSTAQRNAIKNAVLDAGYTLAEVNARFPNLADNTLGDVLRFMASRRLKPRYDAQNDVIVCDGAIQPCRDIDDVDRAIQ